jgi:transposase
VIVPLAELERIAIEDAVSQLGCPTKAAKALGISKMTIYRRLQAYAKLPPREDRAEDCRLAAVQESVEIERLRADVQAWKDRYHALSRIGRAAADYFIEK